MGLAALLRSIDCKDGYRVRYRTWSPPSPPRATLVLLNGVMSHSGWFQPLADHLVGAGLKLVGADRRGTGLNEEARGDTPSAGALIDDVRRIVEAERLAGAPVHLGGWCWGAVLAVNVAAALERGLASLVLLAPGLYPTAAVKTRMREAQARTRSSPPATACLESPIPEEMFTRGPSLAFIVNDPLRGRGFSPRFHDVMTKLALGAALRLGQLELPMLLVLARADEATDNAETCEAFQRITRAPVSIEVIDGAHGLPLEAPEALAHTLTAWMAAVPRAA